MAQETAEAEGPRKFTFTNFSLAILRESDEPMEAGAIQKRLAEEYKAIGGYGMSY